MRKKFLALIMSITVAAMVFGGCGNSSASDTSSAGDTEASSSDTSSVDTEASVDDNKVYGKVTSVSDSEITYEVMVRNTNGGNKDGVRPDGSGASDGESPTMPEGSGAPDGERPARPEESGTPDEKDMKGGAGSGRMGFSDTGETSTVNIPDSVTIQTAGMDGITSEASVSDIAEGDIIQLTYDGDTLSSIVIQQMGGKMNGQNQNNDSASA